MYIDNNGDATYDRLKDRYGNDNDAIRLSDVL